MAILKDARGNEFLGSLDQITGGTITDARQGTATLGALNAEAVMDLNGHAVAVIDLRTAAMNATLVFEATVDGTNYFGLPGFNIITETMLAAVVVTTTHAATYVVGVSGFRRVRVRVSAYTSGNIVAAMRGSSSDFAIYNRPVPTTLHVTATAAANTAATATLPAAGAGLYHYITNITLVRNATAALAGTATLIHTSTNLPGNPAWSVGNAMVAGGTQIDLAYSPTTPLKCLAANTNTTVVMAAGGAAVLNRVNVSYYVGA